MYVAQWPWSGIARRGPELRIPAQEETNAYLVISAKAADRPGQAAEMAQVYWMVNSSIPSHK
jgi:hypothetical protein